MHPVVEHKEGQSEDPEGVFGSQLVALDVDVEFLREAVDGHGAEVSGGRVDVGEVVAGVVEAAAAGEDEAAAGPNVGASVAVKLPCGTGKPTLT